MRSRLLVKVVCGALIASPAVVGLTHVIRENRPANVGAAVGFTGVPTDPWGNPIQYETVTGDDGVTHVRTWSLGPDGKPDSGDEIYGEFKRQPRIIPVPDPEDVP